MLEKTFLSKSGYSIPVLVRIGIAVLCAAFATFACLSGFSDETVFVNGTSAAADVFSYLESSNRTTGTILFAALFVVVIVGLASLTKADRRTRMWCIVVALLLALTVGIPMYNPSHEAKILDGVLRPPYVSAQYRTVWYWLFSCGKYLGFVCLWLPLAAIFFSYATNVLNRKNELPNGADQDNSGLWMKIRSVYEKMGVAHVMVIGVVIFVCWLPWCVLLWPANIAADTVAQLVWFRTGQAWDPSSHADLVGYAFSDQHPWLDTLIYGAFDELGLALGSEAWGLWLLALLQTIATALVFGVVLNYLCAVMGVTWRYTAFFTLFIALVPFYGRTAAVIVKDMTAMPFFLLFVVLFMEYVRRIHIGDRLPGWLICSIVATSIICSLTRKISLYIIVGSFLVLVIVARRRLVSAAISVAVAGIMMAVPVFAYPALRIAPGGTQEMLAIPLQQSAMTYARFRDDMDAGDRAAIESVITCSVEDIAEYLHMGADDGLEVVSADAVKDRCFNRNASTGDLLRYLLVWAKQAFQHPGTYLESVAWLRNPFLIANQYDEGWYVRHGWSEKGGLTILPQYEEGERSVMQRYGSSLYAVFLHIPVFSLLMTEGVYVSWIPLLSLALCIVTRRYKSLVYLIPWILSIGTLLLLPAAQSRYSWSLAFGAVLIAAVPLVRERNGAESSAEA